MITDTTKTVRGITVDNNTMKLKANNGLPAGGTTDQVLAKASDEDYDTKWVDAPSGGGGSGEKLYRHNVKVMVLYGGPYQYLTIINKSNELFTYETLKNFISDNAYYECFGLDKYSGEDEIRIFTSMYVSGDDIQTSGRKISIDTTSGNMSLTSVNQRVPSNYLVDTVVEMV